MPVAVRLTVGFSRPFSLVDVKLARCRFLSGWSSIGPFPAPAPMFQSVSFGTR